MNTGQNDYCPDWMSSNVSTAYPEISLNPICISQGKIDEAAPIVRGNRDPEEGGQMGRLDR